MRLGRRVALAVFAAGLCAFSSLARHDPLCRAAGKNAPALAASGAPGGCPPRWCPDDYCPKPLPAVACLPKSCERDCYCPKPLPRIPCPAPRGCAETYCPKPLPRVLCPVPGPWYTCGPSDRR